MYSQIITNHICPLFGAVLANVTYLAPTNSLRKSIRRGHLGDLNPVPFAILTGNALGKTIFACLKKDIYIALANSPGLIFTIWLNAGAIKLQYLASQRKVPCTLRRSEKSEENLCFLDTKIQPTLEPSLSLSPISQYEGDEHFSSELPPYNLESQLQIFSSQEIILLATIFAWFVIVSVMSLGNYTHNQKVDIVGICMGVNLILFFAAPLSTIGQVIQTKDSSSIHRYLMIAMIVMSAFWSIYGYAKFDVYVLIPNACGFILGLIQGLLCLIYPKLIADPL